MRFVTAGEFVKEHQISYCTLKRWRDEGRITCKVLGKKKILYDIDFNNFLSLDDTRKSVIYARVSTTSQKDQLENQISTIKNYMMNNGIQCDAVYSDIGSGMNSNRKSFNDLLNSIIKGEISKVYITFKDRLTRFGYEYFENLFKKYNVEIIVLDKSKDIDNQKELVEDLVSIIHYYSMKIYSSRRKRLGEIKKILKEDLDK